jgi:DNA-binding Lrp family transcriptional regulator
VIVLMRLYPKESAEPIWDFVKEKMHSRETKKVQPILASVQEGGRFVTLYIMTDDIDALGDFAVNDLGKCSDIVYTMTVPLLKMVYLPVPKKLPEKAKRYSIMIRCKISDLYSVFKNVIETHPYPGLNATFSALILGKYDVLLSMVAESRDKLEEFIDDAIMKIDGVRDVEVFPIEKSWIVVEDDDWKRLQRAMLYIPTWMTHLGDDQEFAFYLSENDVNLSGMMRKIQSQE